MITSRMRAILKLVSAAMMLNVGLPTGAIAKELRSDGAFFGLTYGDWSAAWWQYVLSIPAAANPLNDTTGENCGVEQSSGPVFYLAGSFVGEVTRSCDVPAGKVLFFPIINAECSTVEDPPFFGANEHALRSCAAGFADLIDPDTLAVTVDRRPIRNLRQFRAQSPSFAFTFPPPPAENVLGVDGTQSGISVSDGYWIALEPLSPGEHELHFEGKLILGPGDEFPQNVTYLLTIVE
jgi:hypothetical protein